MKLWVGRLSLRGSSAGSTLGEAMISLAVISLFLAGICQLNWKSIALLRFGKQEAAACFCLQEREEELRNFTWAQITDATYLLNNLMNTDPSAGASAPGETEQLTINAYPTATTATQITRAYGGSATILSSNAALSGSSMIRVDFQVTWPKASGPPHVRQFTTVIAQGGITR